MDPNNDKILFFIINDLSSNFISVLSLWCDNNLFNLILNITASMRSHHRNGCEISKNTENEINSVLFEYFVYIKGVVMYNIVD